MRDVVLQMWGTYRLILMLLCIFSISAANAVAGTSLVKKLNALSLHYSVPLIYNASLLEGLMVEPSSKSFDSLEKTLDAWLGPLSLSWKHTEAGILVFRQEKVKDKPPHARTMEEVTVTGQTLDKDPHLYSLNYHKAAQYARQMKSHATGEMEYATGAMLNRLPAENLAEALQAVPGLSITRDRGEALNISAMGLGSEFQLTLLNGHRLANTENVRNSNQYGQQYRFDTLSADLFTNIEVFKTASTALPAGASGATVNLLSDDPLAYDNNSIQVALTAASLEAEKNYQPGFAIRANGKSADSAFGVLAQMHYENRLQRQFQFESWHWGNNAGAPPDYHWDGEDDLLLVPTDGLALTIENEDRTRATYYLGVAFKPTKKFQADAIWFRSDTDFSFDEHRLAINPLSKQAHAEVTKNNGLANFTFTDAAAKTSREESALYYGNQTIQLKAQWQPLHATSLLLTPFYSHSQSNSDTLNPISRVHVALTPTLAEINFDSNTLINFDFASNLAVVDSYSHISQMSKRTINVLNQVEEWGVDSVWLPSEGSALQQLQTGFLHSRQLHEYTRRDVTLPQRKLATLPDLNGRWLEPLPEVFEAGFVEGDIQRWLIPKRDLFQLYEISLPFGNVTDSDRLNSYEVTFDATEAFLTTNWILPYLPDVSWEAGARFSYTQSRTSGAGVAANGSVESVGRDITSSDWLPALKVKWQPSSYWQWRFSASRSLNRPNYSDLNPKVHVNSAGLPYAEAGNPALRPVTSDTMTLSLAYLQPAFNAQILGFHHDLRDFIIDQAVTLEYQEQQFNTLMRTNNGRAHISGIQASNDWQLPSFFEWLDSGRVSATFTKVIHAEIISEDGDTLSVEGTSDWTGNIRWLFSAGVWQGALNVNYRSDFLEQRDLTNNADTRVEGFTGVDLSVNWLYSTDASLRLDIYNATNENITRTAATDTARSLMKAEEFGRRFVLSLMMTL